MKKFEQIVEFVKENIKVNRSNSSKDDVIKREAKQNKTKQSETKLKSVFDEFFVLFASFSDIINN